MTSKFSDFAARLRGRFFPGESSSNISRADASDSNDDFNDFALELYALQFEANSPYRRFCQSRRISPDIVKQWTQIPAIPAAAFKEIEVSCLPIAERTNVFHSSGTTVQKPSRHFHSPESLKTYEESLWAWFRAHVLDDGRRKAPGLQLVALTPPPSEAPHSSLVHMFECVRQRIGEPKSAFVGRLSGDGAWALDFDAALVRLKSRAETQNPVLLLGTAFSFVHLLDVMKNRQVQLALPDGTRIMETGGYKGRSRSMPRSELRSFMTRQLGVPASHIVCEYGMSELSSQAYDRKVPIAPHGLPNRSSELEVRTFRFPLWARAHVISPETGYEVEEGETGLLRIFDLANIWSVMAIQTEDLAVRRGNGFELLGRAMESEPRGCSLMAVESRDN